MRTFVPLPPEALDRIKEAEKSAFEWYSREREPLVDNPEFQFTVEAVTKAIGKRIRLLQALAAQLVYATCDVHGLYRPGAIEQTEIERLTTQVKAVVDEEWLGFIWSLQREPLRRDKALAVAQSLGQRTGDPAIFETWRYPPPDLWQETITAVWKAMSDGDHDVSEIAKASFLRAIDEAVARYKAPLSASSQSAMLDPRPAYMEHSGVLPADQESSERLRAADRQAVVMPILASKRWKRGRWATEAGVGKNSVYEYLDGRRTLTDENRKAMAEALGLKLTDLPE